MIRTVWWIVVLTDVNVPACCRFAQRVSMIKNRATVNEDVDPSVIIRRLKGELLTLREEVAYLKV